MYRPVHSQDGLLPLDVQKQVHYRDEAKVSLGKEDLFKRVQSWISDRFGNYENAVTYQDQQSGKLVVNSYLPIRHSLYQYLRFELTISCDDSHYTVALTKPDGISQNRTPVRISSKENDMVMAKSMLIKTETSHKNRLDAAQSWQLAKADNEAINDASYKLLATLKTYVEATSP